MYYKKDISIPDNVTGIGSSAFYGCSMVISAVLGKSVKSVGSNAFYNYSRLNTILSCFKMNA